MQIIVILLIALVALAVVSALISLFSRRKGEPEAHIVTKEDCSTCSGDSPTCEQTCMMEAATKAIEYFDDEELDVFRGRPSDEYADEEVEKFSYVLYTMRPEEVKQWNRSLHLRGIAVPDQLKDELFMMMEE